MACLDEDHRGLHAVGDGDETVEAVHHGLQ